MYNGINEEGVSVDVEATIREVVDCAYHVRGQLSQGFEEKIYKNAMCIEMGKRGLEVKTEVPVNVYYDDIIVGQYRADIIVNNVVIIELKANHSLCPANEVQLVNYLNALHIDNGLLINFGGEKLECKRKFRKYKLPFQ
ncbi:GxxExxY protein [Prevotella koreensis]|uniref:GxxExxY protein n=1 Tax=Prevotella koreensis TaxID=2490854 RepID=A0A432LLS7_9BACT|nr:GxxExxY protein [Prevotella koreensis]RUL59773.1 GxxExxY protein [Prevotella koreensis]